MIRRYFFLILVGALLGFASVPAFACLCPYAQASVADMVNGEIEGSSAVFTGKVLGFEYRKGILFERPGQSLPTDGQDRETMLVRFEVDRWWKMPQPSEMLLITDQTRLLQPSDTMLLSSQGSFFGCIYPLVRGSTYLIYASGPADRLQYRPCSRTRPIDKAKDDLDILGKGNKPRKPKTD